MEKIEQLIKDHDALSGPAEAHLSQSTRDDYRKLADDLEKAREVIDACFGPRGLGYRAIRTHIDSCDFATGQYSAVTDPAAAGFDTEPNITGTSDALNTAAIMNLILAADPEIDTIGLLYDLSQDASTAAETGEGT